MGAPKQKWTQDEESALKAGVVKHGAGKWRTILKDPEFSGVLYLRSNVDLKDKWRNMSVMANGWGSREKSRIAIRRFQQVPKNDENATSSVDVQSDDETTEVAPLLLTSSGDMQQTAGSKKSIIRLDGLIMEAIAGLKETGGSNKTNIASYIEEQYSAPPDFKRLLSTKLKFLTSVGKLLKLSERKFPRNSGLLINLFAMAVLGRLGARKIVNRRVKRRYRIASVDKNQASSSLLFEGHNMDSGDYDFENDEQFIAMRAQIDSELAEMRKMCPRDAAIAAARAVAEAERALAEAEEAAREAEAAEAEAEVKKAFAEAAIKDLKDKQAQRMKNAQAMRA